MGGARCYAGLPNNPNYDLPALPSNPCPVGLEEFEEKKEEVVIYPNPASGYVTIKANTFIDAHIVIYDISGKQVYSGHHKTFSVKDLANGVYTIKVICEDATFTKKIIVLK